MFLLLLTCMLGVLSASSANSEVISTQQTFCSKECPAFQTKSSTQEYEVRQYDATKWVSTEFSATGSNLHAKKRQAYRKLHRYIHGGNDENAVIPMALPVITKVFPCSAPSCVVRYVMSFYVPAAYQASTPQPAAGSGVFIEAKDPVTLFVRSFTGYPTPALFAENLAALDEEVSDVANTQFYYKVGYGRHQSANAYNECWLQALEQEE